MENLITSKPDEDWREKYNGRPWDNIYQEVTPDEILAWLKEYSIEERLAFIDKALEGTDYIVAHESELDGG